MNEEQAVILWAIEDIIRRRIFLGVIPALAVGRELGGLRDRAAELAPGLVEAGLLFTGRTLNDTWYITQGYARTGIYEQETRTRIMNEFEKAIKAHLDKVATEDPVFGEKYREALAREDKKKDISHCCNFIIDEVKKTGRRGFTDDEVFGMAMHFYDEAAVTGPDKGQNCQVVVNHEVKLSADEVKKIQDAARKEAEEKVRREEIARIERERKAAEERAKKAEERRKEEEARKKAEAEKKAREEGCLFLFDDMEG